MTESLDSYLILSALLFCIGTFGFLARRNAISMLMSIELMLNAVNLSIVAFGAFNPLLRDQGSIIALMVMAVAAARRRSAWPSSWPSSGTDGRRSSTSTTRCGSRAMPYDALIVAILALPIAGFAFTALFGRRLQARFGRNAASAVPVAVVILSWIAAMIVVPPALGHAEPFGEHGLDFTLYEWIPAGRFVVDVGFHVDALTACLLIVVTTIGMLVHVYSIGYMAHDPGTWRFFAYLNLFMFSMLLLVLADNFLVIFVAWELVGLSQLPAHRVLVPEAERRPWRARRRSSSTASATSGSRSGSC